MTKRELIEALEKSSVEDWAPVLVSVDDPSAPIFTPDHRLDVDILGTVTIHTSKRQEVIIRIDESNPKPKHPGPFPANRILHHT